MHAYDSLSIGPGVQEAGGAASALFAIPETAAGVRAQRVAIRVVTVTETMYILPVQAGGVVTAETGLPVAKETPAKLTVAGYTHLAAIRQTNDVVFNITPLND